MPFKDRLKQLRYMRQHSKENRELLKQCKAKLELNQTLTKRMLYIARNTIQERRNYPIQIVHELSPTPTAGITLEMAFRLDSEDALKSATQAVCEAEDDLIRNTKDVRKIGIIHDLQLFLLNDKVGLVRERIMPLSEYDLTLLRLP